MARSLFNDSSELTGRRFRRDGAAGLLGRELALGMVSLLQENDVCGQSFHRRFLARRLKRRADGPMH